MQNRIFRSISMKSMKNVCKIQIEFFMFFKCFLVKKSVKFGVNLCLKNLVHPVKKSVKICVNQCQKFFKIFRIFMVHCF
jgi:hypothetical protein